MSDLLPLLPLGAVVFPGMTIPLRIFEARYRRMLDQRLQRDPAFGIVLLRSGRDTDVFTDQDLSTTGTAVRLVARRILPGGQIAIEVQGTRRFAIQSVNWDLGYGLATIAWHDETVRNPQHLTSIMQPTLDAFNHYVQSVTAITGRVFDGVRISPDPLRATWDLAARLPLHVWERQRLLELPGAEARAEALSSLIRREQHLLVDAGVLGVTLEHPGHTFTLN
ncbi:MAG: LON peptidase substrate-binding domain-containing protein [Thermomicrobiales bacterium]